MRNSGSQKFEESWQAAFSDAEVDPSDRVWANIDLQLSRAESSDMKRRVVFYQRLAAASVIFAIGLSGVGIWYSSRNTDQITEVQANIKNENQEQLSANENELTNSTAKSSVSKQTVIIARQGHHKQTARENRIEDLNNKSTLPLVTNMPQGSAESPRGDSISNAILLSENDGSSERKGDRPLNEVKQEESKVKDEPVKEILPSYYVDPMVAQVESTKKKTTDENWWASLGGAAGSYNPNISPSSSASRLYQSNSGAYLNASSVSNQSSIGTSFSFGMNFGKKIAPRLILMSGFNYLTQSVDYSSNVAMLSANNSASFAADFLSQASTTALTAPTTAYTINSASEFVSVPLQAGYLFIDRRMGLQLNAGISTDFFVKNTLTDQSGQLSSYTQGAGDNSLYRTVNWAGLMGTELSYKVAKHYRISVVPGLRYSFNSVIKSNTGTTLNPMIWDIGFRFRYMF